MNENEKGMLKSIAILAGIFLATGTVCTAFLLYHYSANVTCTNGYQTMGYLEMPCGYYSHVVCNDYMTEEELKEEWLNQTGNFKGIITPTYWCTYIKEMLGQ